MGNTTTSAPVDLVPAATEDPWLVPMNTTTSAPVDLGPAAAEEPEIVWNHNKITPWKESPADSTSWRDPLAESSSWVDATAESASWQGAPAETTTNSAEDSVGRDASAPADAWSAGWEDRS